VGLNIIIKKTVKTIISKQLEEATNKFTNNKYPPVLPKGEKFL